MKKRQIINIINFVRAVEPRVKRDLTLPVKKQIELMKKHSLKGTFLLQYDTLVSEEMISLFKDLDKDRFEIGVWYETVQPQVEACGIEWKGRFPWDWHPHCGFPVGYSVKDREKLIDVLYEKFKEIFGYYPRVMGSWFFDSHTLRYVEEKYQTDALCNCKDQYGTDGYTLWGGYYGQGYYPDRNNVFLPARKEENQINIPLFRMLGSDPVYQFDYGIDADRTELKPQRVISLEPVYAKFGGGGDEKWTDWYMKENFNGECLSFGYAQAGQENSFSWESMEKGLTYQFALFEKLRDEGKIEVEKLGETGRWYKENYKSTPASAITAHSAFDSDKKSVWYSTKNYRINLYGEDNKFRIRDIHIFSENHKDPYEENLCTGTVAVYDALPFVDGNRYTGKGVLAGGYFAYDDKNEAQFDEMNFIDNKDGSVTVIFGDVMFELNEDGFKIIAEKPFTLENKIGIDGNHLPETKNVREKKLELNYNGVNYSVIAKQGIFINERSIKSENNIIEISFETDECENKSL